METEAHGTCVVGGAVAVATAPLIRVLCQRRIRVGAIHVVAAGLMCCILEQLDASDPKHEGKDQQQEHC